MALLFSAVTMISDYEEVEFFVGGIPREMEDLEGWLAYDDFMEEVSVHEEIQVQVSAYLYGEGESNVATPEEVAYMMKRMDNDPEFLVGHCDCIEDLYFTAFLNADGNINMEF